MKRARAAKTLARIDHVGIGAHRAQHLDLAVRVIADGDSISRVLVDDSESPLAWLARRKGRDGRPMIASEQFIAGENCAPISPARRCRRASPRIGARPPDAPRPAAAPGR